MTAAVLFGVEDGLTFLLHCSKWEKTMPEEWCDKAFVKKRLQLNEEELGKVVFERMLTPYWKRPDGVYMPLSCEISPAEEGCDYHRWMNTCFPDDDHKRALTEREILKELNNPYIWFRQRDLDRAERLLGFLKEE